jgi:ATP-binding cassette, subfamily C (CFTR/MRP), member 1
MGLVFLTTLGKSSLLQALFRIVELNSGKIEVDGVNIANIGLDTLRRGLALVPQDPVLFLGTIRENMYATSFFHFLMDLHLNTQRSTQNKDGC